MPVMAPALVPAIMSTTMPLRSRALSTPRCDKPRAAPPPRATPTRTAAEVVDQPLQPVGQRPAGGQFWRRFVDFEIAGSKICEVRNGGDHGTVALEQPGDADLVAPASGRHVDRLQAADRGVRRICRDEIDGAVDELHEPRRPFRRQVGVDVENDSMGVLPLCDLLSDFLRSQISAVLPERPEPHIGRIQPHIRIA